MSKRSDLICQLADEVIVACDLNGPKPRSARGTIIGACGDAYDAGYKAGLAAGRSSAGACPACAHPWRQHEAESEHLRGGCRWVDGRTVCMCNAVPAAASPGGERRG